MLLIIGIDDELISILNLISVLGPKHVIQLDALNQLPKNTRVHLKNEPQKVLFTSILNNAH